MSVADLLSQASNVVTIIGLPATIYGIYSVYRQFKSDGLAASASAIGVIHENIHERLLVVSAAEAGSKEWNSAFRNLLNELEMACAIYLDGQFSGRTGEIAEMFIVDIIQELQADSNLHVDVEAALERPETFKNIRDFLAQKRRPLASRSD